MGSSFVLRSPPFAPLERPTRVLVTGAAGQIGSYFAQQSHARYQLTLMVLGNEKPESIEWLKPLGRVVTADLSDLDRLKQICRGGGAGIDVVLHLAGNASAEAKWADLLRTNIMGTYNIFAAALAAGCRRVVYASSIHAVSGYPEDIQVKTGEPVNPGDMYGVSKVFGEGLAIHGPAGGSQCDLPSHRRVSTAGKCKGGRGNRPARHVCQRPRPESTHRKINR